MLLWYSLSLTCGGVCHSTCYHKPPRGTVVLYMTFQRCEVVCKCEQTHPVLGEERRSDTWYMPLVLPERLEFLWRDTNMQVGGKRRKA